MDNLFVEIVGLKHRRASLDFIKKLDANLIIFKSEPENAHDKFAVKAIYCGFHFGYTQKDKSEHITFLLANVEMRDLEIISSDAYKVLIKINYESHLDEILFTALPDADRAGIYGIKFKARGTNFVYIGQSNHINNRLRGHFSSLSKLNHHNDRLQSAWISDNSSFTSHVLMRAPQSLTPFQLKIWLFEKELYFIEKNNDAAANALAGDLVFTKQSSLEFDQLLYLTMLEIKKVRAMRLEQKNKIGQEIIDKGIIMEGRFGPSIVKASNVLLWLNKTRYGWLDYQPSIDANNAWYNSLLMSIRSAQAKIAILDRDKKLIDTFKKNSFKNKGQYETCDIKLLRLVQNTLKTYIGFDSLQSEISAKNKATAAKSALKTNASKTNNVKNDSRYDANGEREFKAEVAVKCAEQDKAKKIGNLIKQHYHFGPEEERKFKAELAAKREKEAVKKM